MKKALKIGLLVILFSARATIEKPSETVEHLQEAALTPQTLMVASGTTMARSSASCDGGSLAAVSLEGQEESTQGVQTCLRLSLKSCVSDVLQALLCCRIKVIEKKPEDLPPCPYTCGLVCCGCCDIFPCDLCHKDRRTWSGVAEGIFPCACGSASNDRSHDCCRWDCTIMQVAWEK